MRIWILCAVLTACGGIIDTGDGGNTGGVDSGNKSDGGVVNTDASTTVDSGTACSQVQTETAIDSNGGCQASASWSCGDTKYTIQCNCPSTQCTCAQQNANTGTGMTLNAASFCPKCDGSQLPAICGFPTN